MLVIRLNRVGRRNKAQFRIVVQEHTIAPGGRHIAIVGSYNPHTKVIILKEDEIKKYIANGAQPSDSVHNLLVRENVIDAPKRSVKMPDKEVEEGAEDNAEKKEEIPTEKVTEKKVASAEKKEDAPAEQKTLEKKSSDAETKANKEEKSDKKETK